MYCLELKGVEKSDELPPQIGYKAYNLELLLKEGFNIPAGFVLTASAYLEYLKYNGLQKRIYNILRKTNLGNISLQSNLLKKEILSGELPEFLKREIKEQIEKLKTPYLAVRSSAIGEDVSNSSFAGLYESFLGVKREEIFEVIKRCWASLYNPSAIFYRLERSISEEVVMCVLIQQMVRSKVSGVVFSSYPSPGECRIEAIWGLGNLLVSGKVEPDVFTIDKERLEVKTKALGSKHLEAVLSPKGIILRKGEREGFSLSDEEAITIARYALALEGIFEQPQDIEWALEKGQFFLLQARTLKAIDRNFLIADAFFSYSRSAVIRGKAFVEREIEGEGILVIGRPEPRFVPLLKNAKAVICEVGGVLNHFAILCRELGIPFIVKGNASKLIKDGEFVEIRLKEREEIELEIERKRKWLKIMSFIPPSPPPFIRDFQRETVPSLPSLIGKEYKLAVEVRRDGVYVSRDSFSQFLSDVLGNLDILSERLLGYEDMPEKEKSALPVLASLIVEPLFEELSLLTGSRNAALNLIKGTDPLYLKLDKKPLQDYLRRFGLGRLRIPSELRKRSSIKSWREDREKLLKSISQPERAEKLAGVIKMLVQAYEDKDLLRIYCT